MSQSTERNRLNRGRALAKHLLRQLRQKRMGTEKQYATVEDIRRIFTDEIDVLYRLSHLLTSDPGIAERCFVAGLEDAVKENHVFKEWARSWAKDAIIRNAVRALRPSPWGPVAAGSPNCIGSELYKPENPYRAVLALADFERFAFVVTVLERYSDTETARLLGCSIGEVRDARIRALDQVASLAKAKSLEH